MKRINRLKVESQIIFIHTFLYAFFLFAFAHLLLFLLLFTEVNSTGSQNIFGLVGRTTPDTRSFVTFSGFLPFLAALFAPLSFSMVAAVTALKRNRPIWFTSAIAAILLHYIFIIFPGLFKSVGAYVYVWMTLLSALLLGFLAQRIQHTKNKDQIFTLLSLPFISLFLLYLLVH